MLARKPLYPDTLVLIKPGISLKDLGRNYRATPSNGATKSHSQHPLIGTRNPQW